MRHLIRGKQMVKCSKAEVRRLKTALRWKIPVMQHQRIQMVLLCESGMTQPAISFCDRKRHQSCHPEPPHKAPKSPAPP